MKAMISENTGRKFEVLHLLGGGVKDGFLCQMTADSLGIPVIAGPAEATAIGNIMLQLIALGDIKNIDEGRSIIRARESVKQYLPEDTASFEKAYEKFLLALNKN